jgi:hypothetical protein
MSFFRQLFSSKILPSWTILLFDATVREYDFEDVSDDINALIQSSYAFDSMATVAKMKDLVPEFKSLNSKYSVLDNQ